MFFKRKAIKKTQLYTAGGQILYCRSFQVDIDLWLQQVKLPILTHQFSILKEALYHI